MKSMNLGTLGESVNKYKCYMNCIYLTGRLERPFRTCLIPSLVSAQCGTFKTSNT